MSEKKAATSLWTFLVLLTINYSRECGDNSMFPEKSLISRFSWFHRQFSFFFLGSPMVLFEAILPHTAFGFLVTKWRFAIIDITDALVIGSTVL